MKQSVDLTDAQLALTPHQRAQIKSPDQEPDNHTGPFYLAGDLSRSKACHAAEARAEQT